MTREPKSAKTVSGKIVHIDGPGDHDDQTIIIENEKGPGNGNGIWRWISGILVTALVGATMTMLVAFTKPSKSEVRTIITDIAPWTADKPLVESFMDRTDRDVAALKDGQKAIIELLYMHRIDDHKRRPGQDPESVRDR